jgi:hypothetical protein
MDTSSFPYIFGRYIFLAHYTRNVFKARFFWSSLFECALFKNSWTFQTLGHSFIIHFRYKRAEKREKHAMLTFLPTARLVLLLSSEFINDTSSEFILVRVDTQYCNYCIWKRFNAGAIYVRPSMWRSTRHKNAWMFRAWMEAWRTALSYYNSRTLYSRASYNMIDRASYYLLINWIRAALFPGCQSNHYWAPSFKYTHLFKW